AELRRLIMPRRPDWPASKAVSKDYTKWPAPERGSILRIRCQTFGRLAPVRDTRVPGWHGPPSRPSSRLRLGCLRALPDRQSLAGGSNVVNAQNLRALAGGQQRAGERAWQPIIGSRAGELGDEAF